MPFALFCLWQVCSWLFIKSAYRIDLRDGQMETFRNYNVKNKNSEPLFPVVSVKKLTFLADTTGVVGRVFDSWQLF